MQKLKSLNWTKIINVLKCCLIGILTTLVGIIVLAVVLRFVDMNDNVTSYINNTIKGISIFIMIFCLHKTDKEKLIIKALVCAVIYSLLTFVIFSIMNTSFHINLSILYDVIFSIIVALVSAIIVNLFIKKN